MSVGENHKIVGSHQRPRPGAGIVAARAGNEGSRTRRSFRLTSFAGPVPQVGKGAAAPANPRVSQLPSHLKGKADRLGGGAMVLDREGFEATRVLQASRHIPGIARSRARHDGSRPRALVALTHHSAPCTTRPASRDMDLFAPANIRRTQIGEA